jgi:CheY-like chemotaxis protein
MPLVLIVDDLSFERQRVGNLVAREGYDFVDAANGLEALALIDERRPDCILSDLIMPEMDGFDLLAVLQDRGSRIPVIVLTADRQNETREQCERLGAVAVLHKDWDPAVLAELLRKHLPVAQAAASGLFSLRTHE